MVLAELFVWWEIVIFRGVIEDGEENIGGATRQFVFRVDLRCLHSYYVNSE